MTTKPPETLRPRAVVLWFAEHMERVLRRNDHKGGWEGCDVGWLKGRLREECTELEMALDARPNSVALDEAVDVANFAMMIADKLSAEPTRVGTFLASEFRAGELAGLEIAIALIDIVRRERGKRATLTVFKECLEKLRTEWQK